MRERERTATSFPPASDLELEQTLDLLSERVCRYRVDDLTMVYCNRAWAAQHRTTPDALIGRRLTDLLGPGEVDGLHTQLAVLGPENPSLRDPVPRPAPYMPGHWIEWADTYLPREDGDQVLAVGRDITERLRVERRLTESEARFRSLADRSADVVWRLAMAPVPHLAYVSPSVEAVTGWAPEEFGDDLALLRSLLDDEGQELLAHALAGAPLDDRFDLRVRRADGGTAVLELHVVRLQDGLQGVGRDVTEIRRLQDELAALALRDHLTGLANRRLLEILLTAALARVQRSEATLVVTYLDLDDFKAINDTYGHAAGDEVLVEVARRLLGTVRGADVVARLGGDEFVVVHESPTSADAVARRLRTALAAPFTLSDGTEVACSASLGQALTADHTDGAALLAAADASMYEAKRLRRFTGG